MMKIKTYSSYVLLMNLKEENTFLTGCIYRVGIFKEIMWMCFTFTCYSFAVCDYYHYSRCFSLLRCVRVIYDSYCTDEHCIALLYSWPHLTLEIKMFTGHLYLQFFYYKNICMVLSMHKVKYAADHLVWIMNIQIFWTQSTQQHYQKYMRTYLINGGLLNQLVFRLSDFPNVKINANIHVKCLTVMKLAYFSCPT